KYKPVAPEPYTRLAKLLRDAGRESDVIPLLQGYSKAEPANLPLKAVLAAEMAREPETRRAADDLFAKLSAETNDPAEVEVILRSDLDTERAREVVAELDRAFALLEEKPGRTEPKPADSPEAAKAKAFAAEKARVVGEILKADPVAAEAILRAAV